MPLLEPTLFLCCGHLQALLQKTSILAISAAVPRPMNTVQALLLVNNKADMPNDMNYRDGFFDFIQAYILKYILFHSDLSFFKGLSHP